MIASAALGYLLIDGTCQPIEMHWYHPTKGVSSIQASSAAHLPQALSALQIPDLTLLKGILCPLGPGRLTGVRAGWAFAQGLSLACQVEAKLLSWPMAWAKAAASFQAADCYIGVRFSTGTKHCYDALYQTRLQGLPIELSMCQQGLPQKGANEMALFIYEPGPEGFQKSDQAPPDEVQSLWQAITRGTESLKLLHESQSLRSQGLFRACPLPAFEAFAGALTQLESSQNLRYLAPLV